MRVRVLHASRAHLLWLLLSWAYSRPCKPRAGHSFHHRPLEMLIGALQEPFLAVVVDPVRTMASGKVEIGAFRTYPEGYKPPDEGPSEYQTIPLSKIEDFGVHAKQVRSAGPSVTYHMSS